MNNNYGTKPEAESIARIWEIAASTRTCMLITQEDGKPAARPMSAHVIREEHAIYFLDETGSAKERQINANAQAMLAFVDKDSNEYVTLRGHAAVSNDREKIRALWSPFYKAWWDSEDDPSIRLITFTPEDGQLWDGLNNLFASGAMLLSAITGAKPKLCEMAKVEITS